MSADLTDFLLARIAEDEQMAVQTRAVEPSRWREDRGEVFGEAGHIWRRLLVADDGNGVSSLVAEHAARFDPSRVAAECEAKRRIVEAFELSNSYDPDDGWVGLKLAVQNLAAVYADHRDYRDEWRL